MPPLCGVPSSFITLPAPKVALVGQKAAAIDRHNLFAGPRSRMDTLHTYSREPPPDSDCLSNVVAGRQAPGRAQDQHGAHSR